MHASSHENMQKCCERFAAGSWLRDRSRVTVLDVGGRDVNGNYADIFPAPPFDYTAADIAPGPGVDIVVEDPYKLPQQDESVDLVISGQSFEHVEFFWELFREMTRVVKADGFIFVIAPSAGPEHRYPVDCYRFYPDAYRALAKYGGVQLVTCWRDERGPWKDLVGVFSKSLTAGAGESLRGRIAAAFASGARTAGKLVPSFAAEEADDTAELIKGEQPYHRVLGALHAALEPRLYLEIGVANGRSLALASCPSIAVDPEPRPSALKAPHAAIYTETSDSFFEYSADDAIAGRTIDLAFIDGMHHFEFALRDFMNVEKLTEPTSVIVLDDIYPNNEVQAARTRRSNVWAGDVWKLYHCLRSHRPDLVLFPINASPTGLLVVGKPDRDNRILWERYNPLVREYRERTLRGCGPLIVQRQGCLSPSDKRLLAFVRQGRAQRNAQPAGQQGPPRGR